MKEDSVVVMLGRQFTAFLKSNGLRTIFLVILGAVFAFTVLYFIAELTERNKVVPQAKTQDTVYVKLVDSLAMVPFTPGTSKSQNLVSTDTTGPAVRTTTEKDISIAQASSAKAPPIPGFTKKQLDAQSETTIPLWKWLVVPALMLMIGTRIFLSYKKLPPPNYKLNYDKDPVELTQLFERHSQKIATLGNPRKIKRFSNKVRFQFHYLRNQGLIHNSIDLDTVLLSLLYIESNLQQMNLDQLEENDKKNPVAWFKKMLVNEAPGIVNDRLATQLLELNKNVIA